MRGVQCLQGVVRWVESRACRSWLDSTWHREKSIAEAAIALERQNRIMRQAQLLRTRSNVKLRKVRSSPSMGVKDPSPGAAADSKPVAKYPFETVDAVFARVQSPSAFVPSIVARHTPSTVRDTAFADNSVASVGEAASLMGAAVDGAARARSMRAHHRSKSSMVLRTQDAAPRLDMPPPPMTPDGRQVRPLCERPPHEQRRQRQRR